MQSLVVLPNGTVTFHCRLSYCSLLKYMLVWGMLVNYHGDVYGVGGCGESKNQEAWHSTVFLFVFELPEQSQLEL